MTTVSDVFPALESLSVSSFIHLNSSSSPSLSVSPSLSTSESSGSTSSTSSPISFSSLPSLPALPTLPTDFSFSTSSTLLSLSSSQSAMKKRSRSRSPTRSSSSSSLRLPRSVDDANVQMSTASPRSPIISPSLSSFSPSNPPAQQRRRASSNPMSPLSRLEQTQGKNSATVTKDIIQSLLNDSSDEEDDEDEIVASDEDETEKDTRETVKDSINNNSKSVNETAREAVTAAVAAAAAAQSPSSHSTTSLVSTSINTTPTTLTADFNGQLFIIYMPKSNFKRFIVSATSVSITRQVKEERNASPFTLPLPLPGKSGSATFSAKAISSFPSLAASPMHSSAFKPVHSNSGPATVPLLQPHQYTYSVSMEDVLSCLDQHSVHYNPSFIWMDLSDFGARFVSSTINDIGKKAAHEDDKEEDANSTIYGGLWYNVVNRSALVANRFSHSLLGEGYAVVLSLDLQNTGKSQSSSASAAQVTTTPLAEISNQIKATASVNPAPVLLSATPATAISSASAASIATPTPASTSIVQEVTNNCPRSYPPLTTLVNSATYSAPAIVSPTAASTSSASISNILSSNSILFDRDGSKRKIKPVESIGEMLDRIADYQRIRMQVKSKNKACERLGYSKGTINSYREKVKQALQLDIDLNAIRKTKYRDFKRVLLAAAKEQGVVLSDLIADKKDIDLVVDSVNSEIVDGVKMNTFDGDMGIGLMARQDAANGKKINRERDEIQLLSLNQKKNVERNALINSDSDEDDEDEVKPTVVNIKEKEKESKSHKNKKSHDIHRSRHERTSSIPSLLLANNTKHTSAILSNNSANGGSVLAFSSPNSTFSHPSALTPTPTRLSFLSSASLPQTISTTFSPTTSFLPMQNNNNNSFNLQSSPAFSYSTFSSTPGTATVHYTHAQPALSSNIMNGSVTAVPVQMVRSSGNQSYQVLSASIPATATAYTRYL